MSSNELNIIETCRKNLSIASPDTLRAVIRLLSESDAGKSEAGVEYAYVAAELMSRVYPVVMGGLSIPSAPVGSIYPSLFSDIESGVMPEINQEDISFITGLIVSTAVLYTDDKNVELLSLEYMNQAIQMNERSVLPLYLRGLVSERNGRYDEALADFSRALELDPSCYPAELGTAGIYLKTGQQDAAVEIMDMLSAQYPYSVDVLITAAEARFRINDYNGALEYSTEALRIVPDDPSILLLRAEIFLEQENLQQASRLIEVLQRLNSTEEEYYLVKSEIERTAGDILSALNTLEEARSNHPGSKRIEEAYGAVLMLSGRREEAREILTGEGGAERTGSEGLIVLIEDAVEMEDWKAAEEYASRLMDSDSSLKAGITSWQVWYLQEDFTAALGIAESLYENYPDSTEAAITYIRTLLSLNRRLQAERIIAGKIPTEKDAEKRSELYYLKSLTDDREEEQLQSLRSALFENLQNVEALVRISALYTEMGDIRKAYRYIKQAAAIAPGNPDIKVQMSELEEQLQ
ncbi:MAG: tetratricopeptide repeat protein [Spirochaetales bacterium]|uniref:Tetratricopeptide repeat protein n=1 Tax=Candidatus Thalassospirochaeta sargassi TaxID=3119039 RepID=A0AAJ1MJ88_9SPIO|nr:tetratricopeptide repeat protein [Spirochaetales bacterium]